MWSPPRETVEEAVGIIAGSRHPVVIAGRGATHPRSQRALLRLAKRIGAPVATSLRGKDLFRGEPFDLGICGTLATPVGLDTIVKADCLLVFGASLNALTTDRGELLDGTRIVQCDTDPAAFGRYYPVELSITGDAGQVAEQMVQLLDEADIEPTGYRSDALATRLADLQLGEPQRTAAPGTVALGEALLRLNEIVDRNRTLVVDGGRFSHQSLQIMNVPEPAAYVHALSVGQIGLSVGYGIGAAVGRPDRPTLVIAGDGGFMLGGLVEFSTAVRHGLDVIVAVMNDSAYGAEYYRFAAQGLDPSLTTFQWPDFAAVASALGGRGVTIREPADFASLRSVLAQRDRPVLIDVKLDPSTIPDPGRH